MLRARSLFLLLALRLLVGQAHATLTYDLRLQGGGKSLTSLNVQDVIYLELWAVVTGTAGAQEGFQEGYVTIYSSVNHNLIRGNLSGNLVTTFAASGSQNGTAQDLDQDGDKDLGSKQTFSNGDFIRAKAASMQTSSGTSITNGREFKLANLTFTVTSINNPLDPTPIQLFAVVPNFSSPIEIEAVWQEDGIQSSMILTPGGTFPSSFPTAGTPVILRAIPEPSAAALLLPALGLVVGARRFRRG